MGEVKEKTVIEKSCEEQPRRKGLEQELFDAGIRLGRERGKKKHRNKIRNAMIQRWGGSSGRAIKKKKSAVC